MFAHLAAIAAGYAFAVAAGHWATSSLMRSGWAGVTARLGSTAPGGLNPHPEHPAALGLLERALYMAAWQMGAREFIGIWLLLKAAGNWRGWTQDSAFGTGQIAGRTAFTLFLLGSGTSLGFGVSGALIAQLLDRDDWPLALLLAGVVIAGTFGLKWFLDHARR